MAQGSDVSDPRNASPIQIQNQDGLPNRTPMAFAYHHQALHELPGQEPAAGILADSIEQPRRAHIEPLQVIFFGHR